MAKIHVIDENNKQETLELNQEQYERLKNDAELADISVDEMAIIHMTNGRTSRFTGKVLVEH